MLFQPGDSKSVNLVRIGGKQVIRGGNGIADGPVDDANITSVMEAVHTKGFKHAEETNARFKIWPSNFADFFVMFMLYYIKVKLAFFELPEKLS